MASKRRKKTKFVPGAILSSIAAISVVPAVALMDCGGEVVSQTSAGDSGAGKPDADQLQGVALAFEGGYPTVVAVGYDSGFTVADSGFGFTVADAGFDAFAPGVTATGFGPDSGDDAADDAPADAGEEA